MWPKFFRSRVILPQIIFEFCSPLASRNSLEVLAFLLLLRDSHVWYGRRDFGAQTLSLSQGFSCRSLFQLLCTLHSSLMPLCFPFSPSEKNKFFVCQVLHGKVITLYHMHRHFSLENGAIVNGASFAEECQRTLTISFGVINLVLFLSLLVHVWE